jgi:hypothetical protein
VGKSNKQVGKSNNERLPKLQFQLESSEVGFAKGNVGFVGDIVRDRRLHNYIKAKEGDSQWL